MKRIIEIEESDLERIREIVERENKTALSVTTRGTAYITIANSKLYNPSGDLISREALKKAIEEVEDNYDGYEPNDLGKFMNKVDDLIDNAPQIEEVSVMPQGEWVYRQEWFEDEKEPRMAWGCNQCGFSIKSVHEKRNFCPYCGARMNDEDKSRIQEESNNMSWDKTSSEQEESEQSNNRTFDGICDLNDGIADPSYINDIIDCSDLGIYPWGNS